MKVLIGLPQIWQQPSPASAKGGGQQLSDKSL
jgi:hypothetical protein